MTKPQLKRFSLNFLHIITRLDGHAFPTTSYVGIPTRVIDPIVPKEYLLPRLYHHLHCLPQFNILQQTDYAIVYCLL